MNRLDRALGILLFLRGKKEVSAQELARRFEVSSRTIYRDIETLSALGVPIYAERGRDGGFRLLEGYFLPPITFTQDEALGLVVGLTFLRSLRSKPFAAAMDTAEKKLLAAVSDQLRGVLLEAQQRIGFEMPRADIFHPERVFPHDIPGIQPPAEATDGQVVQHFLQGIFTRRAVALHYRSPYRGKDEYPILDPLGVFWDREYWYLVGKEAGKTTAPHIWRADRVLAIQPYSQESESLADFDVHAYLGRAWLGSAMQRWVQEAPVQIRLAQRQAARLQQDWYFRHAQFEPLADGKMLMSFGESNPDTVLELLRWLGPGAELVQPTQWRSLIKRHLQELLALYSDGSSGERGGDQ
jgi:predicted DNA-binding transcriptional regulator YafY